MSEYTYFISNGDLFRAEIQQDECPESPREWDNVGHMMCWYRGYELGDENKYDDPYEFLYDLLGKRDDDLTIPQMIRKLERKGYHFIPLAVYEHSGITMWCGSREDHFDAQWDCSDVGWIYVTKKEIQDNGCHIKGKRGWLKPNDKNWRRIAQDVLEGEVETYDQYLIGSVYGFSSEVWDGDDWIDDDSCWGFYSDKWGDELAQEILRDFFVEPRIITEEEMEEKMREDAIMKQVETMVCI